MSDNFGDKDPKSDDKDLKSEVDGESDVSSLVLMNNNQQRMFQCKLCEKAFTQAGNLKRHMRNVHEGRKDFECSDCGKKFKQLQSLKVHKKCVHLGLREYACEICGKQCSTKSSLKSHILNNHSVEPITKKNTKVKCPLCSNVFCHSGSLKRHMRTVHEGRSDFKCDECNKCFKSYQSMKIHKKCVHQGRRDYTCGECGRQLCTKSSLRTHIRNSHPNHDLAEVEARSIMAPTSSDESVSSSAHANDETPVSPFLNSAVAQNILSMLRLANVEKEENEQLDIKPEPLSDLATFSDTSERSSHEEDNLIAVKDIPNHDNEIKPYVVIPLSAVQSMSTEEIVRRLNEIKSMEN